VYARGGRPFRDRQGKRGRGRDVGRSAFGKGKGQNFSPSENRIASSSLGKGKRSGAYSARYLRHTELAPLF